MARHRTALLASYLLLACGPRAEPAPERPKPADAEPAAGAEPADSAGSPAPVGDGAAPAAPAEDPGSDSVDPASYTATQADADTLCQEILQDHDDDATLRSCKFVDGQGLDVGRIDVLELEIDAFDSVREVYVIVRVDEFPVTQLVASAREVPGEEEDYELGKVEVKGTKATLRAELITTTYPNTGDPEAPSGAYDEKATAIVTCDLRPEESGCEREVTD